MCWARFKNQIKLFLKLKEYKAEQKPIIISVRESLLFTKLRFIDKEVSSELFGVKFHKLMVTKELSLLDSHQIYLQEQ